MPEPGRVIFDHSADEAYQDPGSPMVILHADGTRTVLQDGDDIYLRGEGASPEGDRPFLDRLNLTDLSTQRLFQSAPDAYEHVLGFLADGRDRVLIWHESRTEPANLAVADLGGAGGQRVLTAWPDPHPQLTGMDKRMVTYDRGDGVQLSGLLHLPPDYDPERTGRCRWWSGPTRSTTGTPRRPARSAAAPSGSPG